MAFLRSIELHRAYRNLQPITLPFRAEQSEFQHLIVTGPNGSGKSSLLEAVNAALEQTIAGDAQPDADAPVLTLSWDRPLTEVRDAFTQHRSFMAYIAAQRTLKPSPVDGPSKLLMEEQATRKGRLELSKHFLQFLVNRHTEQAYAVVDDDRDSVARIEQWFADFVQHLRWLTGDPQLELRFDRPNYNFRIRRGNGFEFDLHTLADGYASVLTIFAELILRVELCRKALGDLRYEPAGVVLIDEVETHLHLQLQEQILPFITKLMPRVQFIIATHAPPVLSSIANAVVYDLARHVAIPSSELRGINYGVLMTEHFQIESDLDIATTTKLKRARALIGRDERNSEEEIELKRLAGELSQLSAVLSLELWYARQGIDPDAELAHGLADEMSADEEASS